jgi:hypothetical protein
MHSSEGKEAPRTANDSTGGAQAGRASVMLARVGTQADNQKERSGACFSGSPIYSEASEAWLD